MNQYINYPYEKTTTYVYGLFDESGIRYIGNSQNLKNRYRIHIQDLHRFDTPKVKWLQLLAKISKLPEMVVLEVCKKKFGEDREMYWISFGRQIGWNLTNVNVGGHGRRRGSKTRQIALDNWKKSRRLNKLFPNRPKKKVAPQNERVLTAKQRKRVSEGILNSPDGLKRMREANIRPVTQLKDGKVVAKFPSAKEASIATCVGRPTICNCCKKGKRTREGFHWQYGDINE